MALWNKINPSIRRPGSADDTQRPAQVAESNHKGIIMKSYKEQPYCDERCYVCNEPLPIAEEDQTDFTFEGFCSHICRLEQTSKDLGYPFKCWHGAEAIKKAFTPGPNGPGFELNYLRAILKGYKEDCIRLTETHWRVSCYLSGRTDTRDSRDFRLWVYDDCVAQRLIARENVHPLKIII